MNQKINISIIIVNYNVEYFLEQCLNSVYKALRNLNGEVFVVDNNSIDGSTAMVQKKFPNVHLIENKSNVGFSKANNQAIDRSKGEYVLLLNPDTVVEEDTFEKCITYLDHHEHVGGLGVRMIDGTGKFLPESKRGLPTPAAAFYKIFGISKLFPRSKKFAKYHLSYLNEFDIHEIEVLSGAFMLLRKSVLNKIGLLDESFFMYGEDIDLSYRILQGGFKNVYFPETKIIHYKGESTKKSSVNYVFVFYNAMVIFAKKHFSQNNAKIFSFFINLAIYFRASIAILNRLIKRSILPLIDLTIGSLILFSSTILWKNENIDFPAEVTNYAIPIYLLVWILNILYSGGYDKPIKIHSYFTGALFGTAFILIVYALLPKYYQFSRLFILTGGIAILCYYLISRTILSLIFPGTFGLFKSTEKNYGIVGSEEEKNRVLQILKQAGNKVENVISISPSDAKGNQNVGTIEQLDQIIYIHKINEIIFCAKDTSAASIINWMIRMQDKAVDFKIAQPDSLHIIGSNSVATAGDSYVLEINSITLKKNKRNKRTLDFIIGMLGILFFPIALFIYRKPKKFIRNMFQLLVSKKSLVGYCITSNEYSINKMVLPFLKHGILNPTDAKFGLNFSNNPSVIHKINLIYARDYRLYSDLQILFSNFLKLDRE